MRESYFKKNLVADDESDQSYDGQQYEGPFDNGFFEFGITALILVVLYIGIFIALSWIGIFVVPIEHKGCDKK